MTTTITRRTNKQLVLEAVEDLHRLEQIVTRETLADHTGLKLSIIDDRLKALLNDEKIIRVQRGVFVPVVQHPPARPISVTQLPDGTVVCDIGDDVMKLTPREARMFSVAMAGYSQQAAQIDLGQHTAHIASDLSRRLREMERALAESTNIAHPRLTTD